MLEPYRLAEVSTYGVVALTAFVFAVVVLAGGPRKAPNLYLGSFLLLIALNQGIETLRLLVPADPNHTAWLRVAFVAAAADPFFLYYFASIFPTRNALNRPTFVALVALGCVAILAFVPFFHGAHAPDPLSNWISAALQLFTLAVYGVVFLRLLRMLRNDPGPRPHALLFYAISVAFIPVIVRTVRQLARAALGDEPFATLATVLLPLAVFMVLIRLLVRHEPPLVQRRVLLGVSLGAAIALLMMGELIRQDFGLDTPVAATISTASGTNRWLIFSALASMAVVRYDVLGMPLSTRRKAARVLVAMGIVLLAYLLIVTLYFMTGQQGIQVRILDVALFILILALGQGHRTLIDRVAAAMYGVPPRGDQGAKIVMYQAAVEEAEKRGRTLDAQRELNRLREELELDPKVAEVVDRMSTAPATARLAPGEIVHGRYQVGRLLGRGASGRVFEARDQLLDRDVVLKEVVAPGAPEEARVLQEARLAGRIDHPNVLRVHDALAWEGGILLVTERLEGGTLADRLKEEGPLHPAEAARIFDGILGGLEAVHREGIVHRDLKPANILLTARGTPKIADFGVATARAAATVHGKDKLWGTPDYMAPEQLRGERVSAQSDLYSVGVMMSRAVADQGDGWRAVVERATASRPEARWQSAEEMRVALRRATRRLPGAAGAGDVQTDREPTTI